MAAVCYPRLPTLNDQYYSPDLKLRFIANSEETDHLSVSVHRQHLSDISNYFNSKIQECPVGQESIDISDYNKYFSMDLIEFHYTDVISIHELSIKKLYTHALKWDEESLLQKCLDYLEDKGIGHKEFITFPLNVRKHFFENVKISINTVKNLLSLVPTKDSNQLMNRIKVFMANEVGGFHMHKLWQWCRFLGMDNLTQDMIDYAFRVTSYEEIPIDKFFPILSLWIYMGNERDFICLLRKLGYNTIITDQWVAEIENWTNSSKFSALLALEMYAEIFTIVPEFLCYGLNRKFRKLILAKAKAFTEKDYVKEYTTALYLKFLCNYIPGVEKDHTWILPVKKSVEHYVRKNFLWLNGTPSRCQELLNILIFINNRYKSEYYFFIVKKVANKAFFTHSINVIEWLDKINSFSKRKEFYDYLNPLMPFAPEWNSEFHSPKLEFLTLSALTMVELYEHANDILRSFLEDAGFFRALYWKPESSGLRFLQLSDLILVLDNPDIKLVRHKLLKELFLLSSETLKKFHQEFGNVPELAKACQVFIEEQLNRTGSRSISCFKTFSEFNYEPFDTVIIQWINSDESTTFYNFELKWQIVNHYQLECLEMIERQFNANLLEIEPLDHQTVWRKQFHTMYNLVARKRCVLVLEAMVNWLFTHLGKPCHEDCKVTVLYENMPYFYRTDINEVPSSTLVETMICHEVVKEPVEWYKAFVEVKYGNIRQKIESKLIDIEIASKDTLRELWEIADTNQRSAECPLFKANLEQRLKSGSNKAKRIKIN